MPCARCRWKRKCHCFFNNLSSYLHCLCCFMCNVICRLYNGNEQSSNALMLLTERYFRFASFSFSELNAETNLLSVLFTAPIEEHRLFRRTHSAGDALGCCTQSLQSRSRRTRTKRQPRSSWRHEHARQTTLPGNLVSDKVGLEGQSNSSH
jgi:hypothetical protein